MSSKRVLFAYNQHSGASNIEQITGNLPNGWSAEVANSGARALEIMQNPGFDVIVSEIQLPDMSGIVLLKKISELYPGAVRVILADSSSRGQILQGAGCVHQFIAKPCGSTRFNSLLTNSLALRELLSAEELRDKIASIGSLPSPPQVYNQLVQELQSETASIPKIADLIKQDISVTAKLLQVVNSAFFGLSTPVSNPLQAVRIIGLDSVKSLVLATGVFNQFEGSKSSEFSVEGIFNRSMAVGAGARLFATALGLEMRATDDSFLGGMLHDVGKLVMLMHFGKELDQAMLLSREKSIPLYLAEKQIMDVSDAEVGAYLLSLWGIPDTILETAAFHYSPHKTANPILNALTCVHLAYAFDEDMSNDINTSENSAVDMDYLTQIGLADQVEDLRNLCMGALA